jgi:hypothetical protein
VVDPNSEVETAPVESDFEARVVPLFMTAISQVPVPKELARLLAQYARPVARTRTVVGPGSSAHSDEISPVCVAMDATDPVAGPQLMIGELTRLIRCLNLRTQTLSTIVVSLDQSGQRDGPALRALIGHVRGLVVAPNGVLFTADTICTIRRISAAEWPRPTTRRALRPDARRSFRCSGAVCSLIGRMLSKALIQPWEMALHIPSKSISACAMDPNPEHSRHTANQLPTIDTRTGTLTELITSDLRPPGVMRFDTMGCVIESATRSLVSCDYSAQRIVRMRCVPL